jgi:ATP-dependent Clp protease ATP-binding subunit ClpA
MFERFTNNARRTLVLAQENSRLLQNGFISPAHVILGVLHEDGLGAQALTQAGFSNDPIYAILDRGYPKIGNVAGTRMHIPFTESCKEMLELSLREALQLGHNYIGPEHMVLAWIRLFERKDSANFCDEASTQILATSGKTTQEIRSIVIEVLSRYQPASTERNRVQRVDPHEDFSIDVEIPYMLQESVIDSQKRLLSFLMASDEDSGIDTSLSEIAKKLGHMQAHVSLQKSEMLAFCTWYGTCLSHLVPTGHPFQRLYEIFMSTLHPGLYR